MDGFEDDFRDMADVALSHPQVKEAIENDPYNLDPLHLAEQITGNSYKDCEKTRNIGFTILQAKRYAIQELSSKLDDTDLNCEAGRFKRIVEDIGYKEVLCIKNEVTHDGHFGPGDPRTYHENRGVEIIDIVSSEDGRYIMKHYEYQYFCWLDGILLVWETHQGNVNRAAIYCMTSDRPKDCHITCNWVGPENERLNMEFPNNYLLEDDGREGIRRKTKMMQEQNLHQIWPYPPHFIWFVAYWEKGENYQEVNKRKYDMLPEDIRKAIKIPNED